MKAIYIERYGNIDGVQIGKLPKPALQPDDVLIHIHAAGINPLDLRVLEGEFKAILPVKFPFTLGNDLAGVVVEVGSQIKKFKIGDEVYAKTDQTGAFAEYAVVKASALSLKPKNLSMQQAASLPLVALTSWQAIVEIAKVQTGQKVLIHAGSGGVGTIAIQLAKHLGAVVATTTSGKNADWVKALGADIIVDYKTTDFEDVIQDYDVVFDTQGGKTLEKSLHVLKRGGRLISISGPPDSNFAKTIKANWLLQWIIPLLSWSIRHKAKKRGIEYSFLFMQPNGNQLSEIAQLVESGAIQPVVDQVFDIANTKQALEYVNTGRAKGKVVINMIQGT